MIVTSAPLVEAPATSIALPDMTLPAAAIPSAAFPSAALPSMAGSLDPQTWASIQEAGRRANSAEDLVIILRQEIYRLQIENNVLVSNVQLSNTNWEQATLALQRSITDNRNIQTAVEENILLKKKIISLEARLTEFESNITIQNQTYGEYFSLGDRSNEKAVYSESDDGTP